MERMGSLEREEEERKRIIVYVYIKLFSQTLFKESSTLVQIRLNDNSSGKGGKVGGGCN